MDAVHLARGLTGRDVIVKIEGTYHGHHDAVMVSVKPPPDQMGERENPAAIPYGLGYAPGTAEATRVIPFNDAEAVERALAQGDVAGLIVEPAMMNINIVQPVEGYLERVRELCTQHGVPLIFDEVKTGAAVAAGGATELFGVTPDIVCLAKAICGGLPGGAVGMTDDARRARRVQRRPPAGHLQRQPARDGGRPGDAARGPHARRLRAPARHQRAPDGGLRRASSPSTASPPTRSAWAPRAA